MLHPVQPFEFWSRALQRLSRFSEQAPVWKIQALPEIDTRVVDTDPDGVGLGGGIPKPQAGGKILVEHQVLPGVGEFALLEDPDGRVMNLWQEADRGCFPPGPLARRIDRDPDPPVPRRPGHDRLVV